MFIPRPRLYTPSFIHTRSLIYGIGALLFLILIAICLNFIYQPSQNANNLYLRQHLQQNFPALKEGLVGQANFEQVSRKLEGEEVVGFTAQSPLTSNKNTSAGLNIFFPDNYSQPFEIKAGSAQVRALALGNAKVAAQIEDGSLVYRNAYPHTDSLNIVTNQQSKEILLLNSPEAPTTFEYELQTSTGVTAQLQNDAVRFITEENNSLQISSPWLVDAKGTRHEAGSVIHWELEQSGKPGLYKLRLKLDPAGLSYPIAIDPSWSYAGYLNAFRLRPTATLLKNGKVLITGGTYDSGNVDATTELYNPVTSIWSVATSMNTARSQHQAILLANGKVLVVGGRGQYVYQLSSAELYDPITGTWSYTGNAIYPGPTSSLVTLNNGKILRVSDANAADIYDPVTGTWSTTGPFSGPHAGGAVVLPSGKVLVAGIYQQVGPSISATANLYDPVSNTWRATGQTHYGYIGDNLILLNNGKVLAFGHSSPFFQIYDPVTEAWTPTSSTNSNFSDYTINLLPNGQVMIVGSATDVYDNVFSTLVYDPNTNAWAIGPSLRQSRTAHSAVLLASGKLLVIGGSITYRPQNTNTELLDLTTVSLTSVTLTSNFTPAYAARPVDLIAKFDRTYGSPAGSVVFKEGTTVLGTAPIVNSIARLTISNFAIGTHAITAFYDGSTYYLPSASPPLNLQVVPPNTTLTITTNPNPAPYGVSQFKIEGASPDGEPSGFVTLKEGNTVLASNLMNYGLIYFIVYDLPVGTHNLVAYYEGYQGRAGEVSFAPATTQFTLVVTKVPVTMSLNALPYPSTYGQSVNFFGSIDPVGVYVYPTGTVTIKDGTTPVGNATIQGNSFSTVISGLSAGTHSMIAAYAGSSTHEAGTSSTFTYVVNKATSSISVTATTSNSVYGQAVTLKATATSNTVLPAGTVNFKSGATTLGTAALDQNGNASLTLANLDSGNYTITAEYPETTNFTASSSSSVNLTINPANTSIVEDSLVNAALVGQPVTLTAAIRAVLPGQGIPSGNVTFKEGTTVLGTGNLDNYGIATLSLSNLGLGNHNITAVFDGNANFLTSNSSVLTQKIVQLCSGQVVNSASDDGTGATCGTLSYAIKQAALQPVGSEPFVIGLNGSQITLSAPLAVISNTNGVNIILNGGCVIQAGRGVPQAQLIKGNGADPQALALNSNVTIKGVKITGFTGSAIEVQGNDNILACNWLGTADGTTATANGNGVHITGSNNQIGLADQPESGNLISGNTGSAILLEVGSKGNQAYYNWLGWQSNGITPLKNGSSLKIVAGSQIKFGPGNRIT